jgi:DNA primase
MDDFTRVKEAVDLVEVVSRYVHLKKRGARMMACCPFHAEKSESFGIPIGRQFFKCFGCQKGGDVITFVSEIERIDRFEALKRLAEEAGITLSTGASRDHEERDRLLRVLAEAQELYRKAFESATVGAAARRIVEERKLAGATIDAFALGYAPVDPASSFGSAVITNRLIAKGHRREDVVAAGIAGERDGQLYDAMRDRLTIPIRDERGRVLAFGGRRMTDGPDAPPAKYVNTRETPLFSKGRVLFGIDRARAAILKQERVVLVEGYMDVILAHQGGLEIAVAALGTAVTSEHARHLRRLAPRALLFLDGDEAGKRAAERAAPLLLAESIATRVLVLKEDKDPGDFFARGSTLEEFEKLATRDGVGALDFLLERHGLRRASSFEEKMQVASAVAAALAPIEDPLMKGEALTHVARQLDLDPRGVVAKFGRVAARRPVQDVRPVSPAAGSPPDGAPPEELPAGATAGASGAQAPGANGKVAPEGAPRQFVPPAQVLAEEDLLTAMLVDPHLRAAAVELVPEETFVDSVRARLFRGLAKSPTADALQLVEGLLAECSGESEAQRILQDLVDRRACTENAGSLFDGAIQYFKRRRQDQEKEGLLSEYRAKMNAGDADAAREFLRKYEKFRRSRGAGAD